MQWMVWCNDAMQDCKTHAELGLIHAFIILRARHRSRGQGVVGNCMYLAGLTIPNIHQYITPTLCSLFQYNILFPFPCWWFLISYVYSL